MLSTKHLIKKMEETGIILYILKPFKGGSLWYNQSKDKPTKSWLKDNYEITECHGFVIQSSFRTSLITFSWRNITCSLCECSWQHKQKNLIRKARMSFQLRLVLKCWFIHYTLIASLRCLMIHVSFKIYWFSLLFENVCGIGNKMLV